MLANFYFNQLVGQETVAYQSLLDSIRNEDRTCSTILLTDQNSCERVFRAVVYDHPEFVNFPGLFMIAELNPNNNTTLFHLKYSGVNLDDYLIKLDLIRNRINNILQQSPVFPSQYFVCKTILDVLAPIITYDYDVLNEYMEEVSNNRSDEELMPFLREKSIAFTPYGIVVNSKGVCNGIAKLFKILCDSFGIECACVEGKSNDDNKVDHLFNVVEIDGQRAYVDITSSLVDKNFPLIRYDFFLIPQFILDKSFLLTRDHFNIDFNCDKWGIDYFSKNKLWFESINDLRKYLAQYIYSKTKGEVRCYYNGSNFNDEKLEDLLSYILSEHCAMGYYLKGYVVKNGFCNAIIVNDSKEI